LEASLRFSTSGSAAKAFSAWSISGVP